MAVASPTMPIKERFRQLRKAKGMTQQDLAMATGLSLSLIAQLEAGRVDDPRVSTLRRIARALGVRLEEVTGEFGLEALGENEAEAEAPKKPKRRK